MNRKVLQVGSGSMGNRRMRDLSARGDLEIGLYEPLEDRRQAAMERFGISGFHSLESALAWGPDIMIISTPPHTHTALVEIALQQGLHFFCEAELFPCDYRKVERAVQENKRIAAPSCTMIFMPIIRRLKQIVAEQLGALHAYSFSLSANTLGWHPGETAANYYALNRSTNGTREMTVFELSPLSHLFGDPIEVAGTLRSGGELGDQMEDTWSLQMRLEHGSTGQLQVFGGSPQTIRKGMAVGANGLIEFDVMSGRIVRALPKLGIHDTIECGSISSVLETVYRTEISTFIDATAGRSDWPHTYRKACLYAGTLAAAEYSAATGRVETVSSDVQPATLPDQYDKESRS